MANSYGMDLGMQGFYCVQPGEFPDAEYSYYPALIVGIRWDNTAQPEPKPLFDIVVFTEVGVFTKTGVQEGTHGAAERGNLEPGKICMTMRQADREAFSDILGLNLNFFRP